MARPKRMGAYNALDDLPPGGVWGNPEASPGGSGPAWDPGPVWDADPADVDDEPAPRWRRRRLEPVPDALDDLLPGPGRAGPDEPVAAPRAPAARRRGAAPRSRSTERHLGVWNPLDGPPPAAPEARPASAPAPAPGKTRVGFRLPADLVETARDAIAHLAGTADQTTLTALTERALRVELARLAITHNDGRPFPPRTG
jgi:hypothetical protein